MKNEKNQQRKEMLKNRIEEERKKLNNLLSGGGKVGDEDAYRQSVLIDRLLEEYMDC